MQIKWVKEIGNVEPRTWQILEAEGGVFHQKEFLAFQQSLGNQVWIFLGLDREETVAFLPIIYRQVFVFRYAVIQVEPWLSQAGQAEGNRFLKQVFDQLASTAMWIDANSTMARFRDNSELTDLGVRAVPFGTYTVDLRQTKDEMWSKIHPKHRNAIRSAEKNGAVAESTSDLGDVFGIMKLTHAKAGLAFPDLGEFTRFCTSLGQNGYCRVYRVRHNGQTQAAAVIPLTKQTGFYYYGGSIGSSLPGASNALQWHIMQDLKAAGINRYDFGGARADADKDSKAYTIQRFKERFGGTFERLVIWDKIFNWRMYRLSKVVKRCRALAIGQVYHPSLVEQELQRRPDLVATSSSN